MAQSKQIPDSRIVWPADDAPEKAVVFVQNAIDVAAAPEAIWSHITDCVAWPTWYKYCSDVSILRGGASLGAGSKFRFKTLGLYFEPEIVTFEPYRLLVWSARGPAGTSGSHAWFIEPTATGCRVVTEEAQKGIVLFPVRARTRTQLLTSHEEWLRALKERSEAH